MLNSSLFREFVYEDVVSLWERLWTNHLTEHFHLYMCVALLKMYKKKIIDEEMDFDTLLKFINELSGHIDLERAMRDAEALFHLAAWVLLAYLFRLLTVITFCEHKQFVFNSNVNLASMPPVYFKRV